MKAPSPKVADVMTPMPTQVEVTASLETARRLMERYQIRHLPVKEEGKLVGVLSERELQVALAVARTHSLEVTVRSAMEDEPFQVEPQVPVVDVVDRMAREKWGCAVVMDGDQIRGIFTSVDAMKLLVAEYRGGQR